MSAHRDVATVPPVIDESVKTYNEKNEADAEGLGYAKRWSLTLDDEAKEFVRSLNPVSRDVWQRRIKKVACQMSTSSFSKKCSHGIKRKKRNG